MVIRGMVYYCYTNIDLTAFTEPLLLMEIINLTNQEVVPNGFSYSVREKPECFILF